MLTKLHASKKVYDIVDRVIRERMASGVPRDDTLQMLIDHGDEKMIIVGVNTYCHMRIQFIHSHRFSQFIMGLLVAGARSTGTTGEYLTTQRDERISHTL